MINHPIAQRGTKMRNFFAFRVEIANRNPFLLLLSSACRRTTHLAFCEYDVRIGLNRPMFRRFLLMGSLNQLRLRLLYSKKRGLAEARLPNVSPQRRPSSPGAVGILSESIGAPKTRHKKSLRFSLNSRLFPAVATASAYGAAPWVLFRTKEAPRAIPNRCVPQHLA